MRIIIVGMGEVGQHVLAMLEREGHDVVAIDVDRHRLDIVEEHHDVGTVCGYGANPAVLRQAGAAEAGLVAAVTNDDEVNLVSGTERQSDYATEQMKHLASLQMSSDDLKRTSVRSISPSALSDAPLQPDPLMPSSRSGPTTRFIRSGQSRLRAQISL